MINHKTVFGTRSPAFWVGAVIASGSCPPSLQTIVNIEFLCHCRVGCALCFLFFFRSVGNFLKTIFLLGSALKALLNTLVVRWLLRFLIVLTNCIGYFTFSFINSVKVTAKGIPAAVTGLFFALISLYFSKSLKLKLTPLKSLLSSFSISITK